MISAAASFCSLGKMGFRILLAITTGMAGLLCSSESGAEELQPMSLTAKITTVQPMTGIVLWSTNSAVHTAPIQLEYSYFAYDQVATGPGEFHWKPVEDLLTEVSSRGHQAVIRFYDTYVGKPSGIPTFIQKLPGYRGQVALSEKKSTGFSDWSHPELQTFLLDFFTQFAKRYDRDPRLAFLQVGFGLWSEYHIYDGPMEMGRTFPSLEYQKRFAIHLSKQLEQTPWMISVDAAGTHTPFVADPQLQRLPFGLFDDSFNHARHHAENEPNWIKLGMDRWKTSPIGGEFSFFEGRDQREALASRGPHGIPFATHAARFHLSCIFGDAQPEFQKTAILRKAGLACGYQFHLTRFVSAPGRSEVTFENRGIAPIYYDAYPTIDAVRSETSLKGLLPGESRTFSLSAGSTKTPSLTISCDRLVPGQKIEFEARLK